MMLRCSFYIFFVCLQTRYGGRWNGSEMSNYRWTTARYIIDISHYRQQDLDIKIHLIIFVIATWFRHLQICFIFFVTDNGGSGFPLSLSEWVLYHMSDAI